MVSIINMRIEMNAMARCVAVSALVACWERCGVFVFLMNRQQVAKRQGAVLLFRPAPPNPTTPPLVHCNVFVWVPLSFLVQKTSPMDGRKTKSKLKMARRTARI